MTPGFGGKGKYYTPQPHEATVKEEVHKRLDGDTQPRELLYEQTNSYSVNVSSRSFSSWPVLGGMSQRDAAML